MPQTPQTQDGVLVRNFLRRCAVSTELARAVKFRGKSPIGRPGPVTPWGKPTLGYKTRKTKNRTNKFIVKRRNAK